MALLFTTQGIAATAFTQEEIRFLNTNVFLATSEYSRFQLIPNFFETQFNDPNNYLITPSKILSKNRIQNCFSTESEEVFEKALQKLFR